MPLGYFHAVFFLTGIEMTCRRFEAGERYLSLFMDADRMLSGRRGLELAGDFHSARSLKQRERADLFGLGVDHLGLCLRGAWRARR
jgi:hypothetical protein